MLSKLSVEAGVYGHCWFTEGSATWNVLVDKLNYTESKYGTRHRTFFADCCCTFVVYKTNGQGYDDHEKALVNYYEAIKSKMTTKQLLMDFLKQHSRAIDGLLMFPAFNLIHGSYVTISNGQLSKRRPMKEPDCSGMKNTASIKSSMAKSVDYTPIKAKKKKTYSFVKDRYWNYQYENLLSERKNERHIKSLRKP